MTGLGARLRRTLGEVAPVATPAEVSGAEVSGGPPDPAAPPAQPAAPPAPRLDQQLAGYDRAQARMTRWIAPPPAPPPPLESVLPGTLRDTPDGPAFVVEYRFARHAIHGDRVLGDFFTRDCAHLERLTGDPRLAGFRPERALFLDIEATGLDHGAGTLAFLVGLGFLDGDEVVVRQLCLREPSEERALLAVLQEHLERFPYLVSFNGKSYDLSVLQTRMVMQRLYSQVRSELKLRPHLDLLHLSKNLFRGAFEDTRLGTLEARALGHHRCDDIPGHLVPTCWFAWLRHHNPEPLAAVARHNLDDVLSMVTLADLLTGSTAATAPRPRPAALAVNLARLLARRKHFADAAEVALEVDPSALSKDDAAVLHRTMSDCARRLGDVPARVTALTALLNVTPDDDAARRELVTVLARQGEHLLALPHAERLAAAGASGTLPGGRLVERVRRRARAASEDDAG